MIKQISTLSAVALSLGILAGCSSSGAQEQSTQADTYHSGSGEEYRGSEATSVQADQTVVREQEQSANGNRPYGKESQTR